MELRINRVRINRSRPVTNYTRKKFNRKFSWHSWWFWYLHATTYVQMGSKEEAFNWFQWRPQFFITSHGRTSHFTVQLVSTGFRSQYGGGGHFSDVHSAVVLRQEIFCCCFSFIHLESYLLSRGPQWLLSSNQFIYMKFQSVPALGKYLLHGNHHGPWLAKYDLVKVVIC